MQKLNLVLDIMDEEFLGPDSEDLIKLVKGSKVIKQVIKDTDDLQEAFSDMKRVIGSPTSLLVSILAKDFPENVKFLPDSITKAFGTKIGFIWSVREDETIPSKFRVNILLGKK